MIFIIEPKLRIRGICFLLIVIILTFTSGCNKEQDDNNNGRIERGGFYMKSGFSVRCIKD